MICEAIFSAGHRPPPAVMALVAAGLGAAGAVASGADAITSAARYRRDGWWLRPLLNLSCLTLYFAGVAPRTLRRLYG